MPTGTKVDRVYRALLKQGHSAASAARIAQAQTGEALATGRKPKHVAASNEERPGFKPGVGFVRSDGSPLSRVPAKKSQFSPEQIEQRRKDVAEYAHHGAGESLLPKAPAGQIAMADDAAMAGPSSKRTSECLAAANKDRAPAFTPTEKLTGRQLAYGVRHADRSASRTSGQGKRYERHRSNADRLADEGKKRGMPMDELTLVPRGKQPDAPVAMSDEPTNEEMIQPSSERVTPSPGHAILNDLRRGREAREKEQAIGPSGAKSSPSDVSRPAWQYLPDTDTGDQPSRSDYRNAGFRMLPRQPDSIHE